MWYESLLSVGLHLMSLVCVSFHLMWYEFLLSVGLQLMSLWCV